MTPSEPDLEPMMWVTRCRPRRETGSLAVIEEFRAFSEREITPVVLADHVASTEHLTVEESPISTERTVTAIQAMLWDGITGIPALTKDDVTALVTTEGQNKVRTTDNCLQASFTKHRQQEDGREIRLCRN